MLEVLLKEKRKSLEDTFFYDFKDREIEFKTLLSPRLKSMYETAIRLHNALERATFISRQGFEGITYPLAAEIIVDMDKIISDLLSIVRSVFEKENKSEAIIEFEEKIGELKKEIDEYKKKVLPFVVKKENLDINITIYLKNCSSFLYSYIFPLFNDLRESLVLTSDIWFPMEKKFSKFAVNRIAVFKKEEEEEEKKR